MNKSKLISVAVLCALALGACVDDKESASVTALREAKTSYFKSQSDYQAAQAELARVNAEVAKAKAESEIKLAELQAKAAAAKTEAEAAQIKQEAEEAAKRLEVQLIELEAQAKANAARYEEQYQGYLNQLAQAKRDAETKKQDDLSEMIEAYQISLGKIKGYEQTIQTKELEKAKAEQSKLEVMAGEGLAKAKVDSIKKQAELNAAQAKLERYQVLYEAEAAKQKEIVEEVRATLSEQVQKVGEAQTAYVAKRQEWQDLENGEWKDLADSLKEGWRVLNAAEAGSYVSDFGGYNFIAIAGHSKPIFGNSVYDFDYQYGNDGYNTVKYYTWEADRLITDITAELATATKAFEAADTLAGYNDYLKTFYDAFEKAEKAYNEAVKDTEAAQKAVDALPADATQAQIDAANQKLTNAQTAEDLALIKKNDAQAAYETERAKLNTLENDLEDLKTTVEKYTNLLAAVKDAKALCFGEIVTKIKALDEQLETLYDEYQELYSEYQTLKNGYESDKQLVDTWDTYVSSNSNPNEALYNKAFLAKVEQYIIEAKGDVETYKLQLANIIDMMMDPDAIAEKYYDYILDDIKTAQDAIDVAREALEKEEMLVKEYKACIDAWMTGSAE